MASTGFLAPSAGEAGPPPARRRFEVEYDPVAIKRANPLAEVARRLYGVDLHPVGRMLLGLCPLHADVHTPNFYVYPEADPANDRFRCFRCEKGGDVITLVMEREEVSYPQACERLGGARVGAAPLVPAAQTVSAAVPAGLAVSSPPGDAGIHGRTGGRAKVLPAQRRWDCLSLEQQVVMNVAGVIYRRALWANERVLRYLRDRGLPDRVIRACGLGYADGHSLEAYLRRHSGLRVAQELGLLRRPSRLTSAAAEDGPLREFFAGRVVVPEIRAGQIMWFIGREPEDGRGGPPRSVSRPGAAEPPKYLALLGERPVLGFERVAGRREAFLCEGVFDYLTAVAWGLPAFSPCGTHLPPDRLGFLARARAVYGVFDGDDAGREATERFAEHLGGRWRPISLPDGCDLNDLGRQPDGRDRFFRLLEGARGADAAVAAAAAPTAVPSGSSHLWPGVPAPAAAGATARTTASEKEKGEGHAPRI